MNVIICVYYCLDPERISMVNWKVVLVVVIIAVLVMAIGMWFGYRYASEQEDIPPEGHYAPTDTAPQSTIHACIDSSKNFARIIYIFSKRGSKL